jgi:hypothetical protein
VGSTVWVCSICQPGNRRVPGGPGSGTWAVRVVLLVVTCLAALLLGAGRASAVGPETLQVAPGGSDSSCVTPCGAIQVAINDGYADVVNGRASRVTIDVAPGSYQANLAISAPISDMTITGSGIGRTVVNGGSSGSVLTVGPGASATVTDMTLTGGSAVNGGGVDNAGTLTLDRMNVGFNAASGYGGGIFNDSTGTLELNDSTISLNQAGKNGGGVGAAGINTTLKRDVIVSNTALNGGGVGADFDSSAQPTTLIGDTVVSNQATHAGGGVLLGQGQNTLSGDTINGNQAPTAGGLGYYDLNGIIAVADTIVADNQPTDCGGFGTGTATSGFDLFSDGSCPVNGAGDRVGVDPGLGPLQDNGGPTKTEAIAASSPAYDASSSCAGTDQRGVSKLQRGATNCDIGAYQVAAPTLYVANPPANSVTAYATGASGNASPVLTLAGAATGLSRPTGVVVDVAGDVFVANSGANSVTEYAPEVNGNSTPTATISGPLTKLNQPQDLALDAAGHLFVTNLAGSVTEYAPHATGNIAPLATISGSNTRLSQPHGVVVDPAGNLRVANANATVTTYRVGASGNVAPVARLGPNARLTTPEGVAFDAAGDLLVTDAGSGRAFTFAGNASQAAQALRILIGAPALSTPIGLDIDATGDVFATSSATDTVNEYPPGAGGTAAALASIAGVATGLHAPAFLSELPPPPAPTVRLATRRNVSIADILRHGLAIRLAARGVLAFRSGPLAVIGTARLRGRAIAAGRLTLTTPGHATLVLLTGKRAARRLRQPVAGRRLLKLTLKLHDAAGVQKRQLTVRLTQ